MRRILALSVFLVFVGALPCQSLYNLGTLEEAVTLAQSNSKKLQLQELQMLTEMRLAKLSIKAFLPTLSLSISESDTIVTGGPDSRSKTFQVSLSQPVFAGGRNKTQYDLAQVTALYGYYEYRLTKKQLENEVEVTYRQCLLLEEKTAIQQNLREKTLLELSIVEKEFDLGRALESDVLEYRITVAEIGMQIRELEESREKQKRSLTALVGLPPGTVITLTLAEGGAQAGVIYKPLGAYFEYLWPIVRNASVDLEKQNVIFRYHAIQAAQARRFYLPSVTIEGGMSFSGERYPLTEPSWTLKCSISFDNSFLPLNGSAGLTARKGELRGVSTSLGTGLPGNVTWGIEAGRARLSLREGFLGLKDAELALYEGTLDAVQGHDNAISVLEMQRRLVDLAEQRLKVDEYNLRRGDLKRTDFLESLCGLAEKKTAIVETEYRILTYERALEIAADVPFGHLAESLAETVKGDIL